MQNRRYPYQDVGRLAALAFGVAGLIVGVVVGVLTGGGGGIVISAALWAVVAGLVAYLVYATQGPQRPGGYMQAAAADGVVAGAIIGVAGTVLTLAGLSGLGASGSHGGPSILQGILAVIGALIVGGVGGGLWGLALGAVAGEGRMTRIPPPSARRSAKKSSSGKKRKRR